jgi:AhpC/TSA family
VAALLGWSFVRRTAQFAGLVAASTLLLAARDYGPAIGAKMPDFSLRDQNGTTHTLQSLLKPRGAVILFFRSADW